MRVAALLIVLAGAARADDWTNRRKPHRFVSRSGRHVLVASRTDDRRSLAFEFVSDDGTPLGRGIRTPMPEDVRVLDARPAAVLLDVHRAPGTGDALALIEKSGSVRWALPCATLFDEDEAGSFERRAVGYAWLRAWWLDEEGGKVVLVPRSLRLREVRLDDGAVKRVASVALPAPGAARDRALETIVLLRLADALPAVRRVAGDGAAPVATRLRAAVAVHAIAGDDVPRALWDEAIASREAPEDRAWALRHAATHMGDGALAWLAAAARRPDTALPALEAIGAMGEPALPALVELMTHESVGAAARAHAAAQVGAMPADRLLATILKDLKGVRDDPRAAGPLLVAAVNRAVPDLAKRIESYESTMIGVLDADTGPTGWLADYFALRPTTEAVKPLLRQLARHRIDEERDRIIRALRACTGRDFGDDVDAWLRYRPGG